MKYAGDEYDNDSGYCQTLKVYMLLLNLNYISNREICIIYLFTICGSIVALWKESMQCANIVQQDQTRQKILFINIT